jgi:nucleotide-binding universal stress UspA family protein
MAVVVGYVPTAEGRAAIRQAAQECRLRNTRLVVINSSRGGHTLSAVDAARSQEELDALDTQLNEEGLEHEVRQLVRGLEPAEDLIAVAEEVSADLIVIGLRRRTPVGKLILGSNAQRILLDAPCAVLAVKG